MMKIKIFKFFVSAGLFGLIMFSGSTTLCEDKQAVPKEAEPATARANAKVWRKLPFSNTEDFEDAKRGFVAPLPDNGVINVKATYVKYLGWFDGNPATLHVLPPVEASKKYVEFMGGAEAFKVNRFSSHLPRTLLESPLVWV